MKQSLISVAGLLALAAALPTFAGPDWQIIEKARKESQAASAPTNRVGRTAGCPVEPLVLPLDHGPRPLTTPYANQLRKERHEAQVKACGGTTR